MTVDQTLESIERGGLASDLTDLCGFGGCSKRIKMFLGFEDVGVGEFRGVLLLVECEGIYWLFGAGGLEFLDFLGLEFLDFLVALDFLVF